MLRSLMLLLAMAAASIASSQAMQDNREKPFVCESEIGNITEASKYITDEYITSSGERYYRERTQESYCAQLTNGDKFSTTRINKGQGDSFRSIRFGNDLKDQVDLSENSFRLVQQAYLERVRLHLATQAKAEESKKD